ncbi:MAG TPA: Ig-like domain-containing protein [Cyclobacteriaceae bacterium]|nr:Ig-like domain-containing protein [Cyclobacteriaceae bacterium]
MKRILWIFCLLVGACRLYAQPSAAFYFTRAPFSTLGYQDTNIPGWNNVYGDPSQSVVTATDASTGITISSISTSNWFSNNGACSVDHAGTGSETFPEFTTFDFWMQQGGVQAQYNAAVSQLEISGLTPDSAYTIQLAGSFFGNTAGDPTLYTVAGGSAASSQYLNVGNNYNNILTFNGVMPDANGKIRVYVNTTSTTSVAPIGALRIVGGPVRILPTVVITSPFDMDVLAEETNPVFKATVTEGGQLITNATVEYYVNLVKIGQALDTPYAFTWMNPNEGHYLITAKATDAQGLSSSTTINVSVESLTSFWSMTGNVHMNPDSNFVGNVDSVRLAFRTKNIERMSISPLGNIGIGTINPTAQLHTTGTVRLADLTGDSTQNRVVVSDTSGNLFYRNVSSLNSRWLYSNGTLYDSVDNIAIGCSSWTHFGRRGCRTCR